MSKDKEMYKQAGLNGSATKKENVENDKDYYKKSREIQVKHMKETKAKNLIEDPHYYDEAKKIIKENKQLVKKLADFLYKQETITGKEFTKIVKQLKPDFKINEIKVEKAK